MNAQRLIVVIITITAFSTSFVNSYFHWFPNEFNLEKSIQKDIERMETQFKKMENQLKGLKHRLGKMQARHTTKEYEDHSNYYVELDLREESGAAIYSEKEISVKAKKGKQDNFYLTITAEKKYEKEKDDNKHKSYAYKQQKFATTQRLPNNINIHSGKRKYKDGILKITFPIKTEHKEFEIPVE